MNDHTDEEDMVYIGDVDVVLDPLDQPSVSDDEAMEDDGPTVDDSTCVFTGHMNGSVFCCSLNKTGKLAVSGGQDDKAYIWDTSTGNILLDCTQHGDSVIFAEFNHDDTYLATGDMSGTIQAWKMSDYSRVWEYRTGDATWLKWHMAANVLLVGSAAGEVYMWKIPDGDCKIFQGIGCRVETATILPDGKRIAVGYGDGSIRVIDLKTESVTSSIPSGVGHSSTITVLDCHSDNNLLLSAAEDGKTILSTAQTGKIVSVLQNLNNKKESSGQSTNDETGGNGEGADSNGEKEVDSNWVEAAAFCKDPAFNVAATGTVNGEIFIWDIPKQTLRQKIDQESGTSKLLWKGTTSILFSAGLDGILRCYDAKTSHCLRSFAGHTADILDLYLSADGKVALTASDDTTARVFDIESLP